MATHRTLIIMSFIYGIGSILFVWIGEVGTVSVLTREDGVVENLTAIFFMAGLIISFITIFRVERILLSIVWVVLCFIFLGEETSWFQRIIPYSVQGIEQINSQNEFNLHNLEVFHGGNLIDSSIGLEDLFKSQNLFRIGFFGYFLVIPMLVYITVFEALTSEAGYKRPDTSFTFVLLFVFVLSFFLALFSPENVKSALAETREMLYAFFILLYIIVYMWPNKKTRPTLNVDV